MLRASRCLRHAVGFVGLGQMGGRMAPHLLLKSSEVPKPDKFNSFTEMHIADSSAEAIQSVKKACGDKTCIAHDDLAELAAKCEVIVTMLPNAAAVRNVYDKILGSKADKLRLMLDCSTIDPGTARDMGALAKKKNIDFLDAPVSGGVNAAAAGTLTFIVGGSKASFGDAEAVLSFMGKNVKHCGDVGAGQVVKLSNNLILGQHMLAVSEAMNLGTAHGVDPKVLQEVVKMSTGCCWANDVYNPYPGVLPNVPSSNGYKGGFGTALMLKDLRLAVEAAEAVNQRPVGCMQAKAVYETMTDKEGMGGLDFSSILQYIQKNHTTKK